MKKLNTIAASILALITVHVAHADVTATPILVETRLSNLASGSFLSLINSDNNRLVLAPPRLNGTHEYSAVVTLHNPLLALGGFRRMDVRVEAQTSNSTPLLRVLAQSFAGGPALLGSVTLSTSDVTRTISVTTNINRFLLPGGFVRLELHGFWNRPFQHRFDKISVTFR